MSPATVPISVGIASSGFTLARVTTLRDDHGAHQQHARDAEGPLAVRHDAQDAGEQQDGHRHADEQGELVIGAEGGDREILHPRRREVDEGRAQGDHRRRPRREERARSVPQRTGRRRPRPPRPARPGRWVRTAACRAVLLAGLRPRGLLCAEFCPRGASACWACPYMVFGAGRAADCPPPGGTCPPLGRRNGHAGIMSIGRGQGWACPAGLRCRHSGGHAHPLGRRDGHAGIMSSGRGQGWACPARRVRPQGWACPAVVTA